MKAYKQQRSFSVSQGDSRREKDLSGTFSYELEDAPFVASYRANSPQKPSTAFPSVVPTDNMQSSFLSSDINKPYLSKELIYSPFKNNSQMKEESSITVESITEEDLDDWIAQSTNRPIQSFLDPYRQFKAPDQLISQFKKRYPRSRLKVNIGSSKKLYFSQDQEGNKHGRGTSSEVTNRLSSPSPKNLTVTFDANKLRPNQIAGTSIRVRESGYSNKKDPFNNVYFVYGEDTSKIQQRPSTNQQASRSPKRNEQSNFLSNSFKKKICDEVSQDDPEKTIDYEKYDKTHQSILFNLSNRFSKNDSISPQKSRVNSLRTSKQGDQLFQEKNLSIKKGNQIPIQQQTIGEPMHTMDTEDSVSVSSKIKQSVLVKKKTITLETTHNSMAQTYSNVSASQSISKGRPSRVVVLKKGLKENDPEGLQKEVLKKIAEKVEKLLAEKEEKQISENESSSITNSTGLGKEQEDNKPEQNFAHHLTEITDIPKSKDQQESAVASFLKGVGRMKKNKDKSAITAFKQALNFDKTFFPAIYNLACLYERNQRFKMAELWLDIASAFQRNKQAIAYGYAIIFYKQSRYEEAFRKVNGLIEQLESESQEHIPLSNLYLRAICTKRLALTIQSDKGDNETESNDAMTKDQSPSLTSLNKKRIVSPKNTKYLKGIKSIGNFQTEEEEGDKNITKKESNLQLSKLYYDKAANDYQTFSKCIVPNNFKLFKHFMFAIIFKKIRKMEIKFPPHILCELSSLIQQILATDSYLPVFQTFIHDQQQQLISASPVKSEKSHFSYLRQLPLVTQSYFQPGESIPLSSLSKKKEELINCVQRLSFFKRFGPTVIEKYLPCLSIRYIEKNEILFAKKGEVFIITAGHLRVLDHSKKFDEPDIVAFYSQGDIIGCNDKDNKLSFHPDVWFICLTKIEYLVINESDFTELWSLQNSQQHRQILSFIRSIDLFEHVSQLTLYLLAFELLQEKQFTQSDIVYNDGESINKYDYITLVKEDPKAVKNLRNRISNKIDIIPLTQKVISGLYLIQEGSLELSTFGNWHNYTLKPFNFIGENLLIPSLSISRFGQIVCSSASAKCLCLKREHFHKINSVDREVMRSNLQKSEYLVNCQKILLKYYKYYKIEDYNLLRSNKP